MGGAGVTEWDEGRAREGIAAIVAETESALDGVAWPLHPRDKDDEQVAAALATLYFGAAWAIWDIRPPGSPLAPATYDVLLELARRSNAQTLALQLIAPAATLRALPNVWTRAVT